MNDDDAKRIVGACCAHKFHQMGLATEPPPSLAAYSLADLLTANHRVRDMNQGSSTVQTVCDDRLIAALYVAYHYDGDDPRECEPIAVAGKSAVVVLDVSGVDA